MLVIFDLDDTLIDRSASLGPIKLKDALATMIKEGMQISSVDLAYEQLLSLDQTCTSGKNTIQTFCKSYGQPQFQSFGINEYYGNIKVDNIEIPLMPDAIPTIEQLIQHDHKIVLVSHGDFVQQIKKMQKAKLDQSLFSEIHITPKRDKELYYQKVLTKFSLTPDNAVVIGDSIQRDLIPAKNLGIKTIHMRHGRGKHIQYTPQTEPSFSIKSLKEVFDIIDKIK